MSIAAFAHKINARFARWKATRRRRRNAAKDAAFLAQLTRNAHAYGDMMRRKMRDAR